MSEKQEDKSKPNPQPENYIPLHIVDPPVNSWRVIDELSVPSDVEREVVEERRRIGEFCI